MQECKLKLIKNTSLQNFMDEIRCRPKKINLKIKQHSTNSIETLITCVRFQDASETQISIG